MARLMALKSRNSFSRAAGDRGLGGPADGTGACGAELEVGAPLTPGITSCMPSLSAALSLSPLPPLRTLGAPSPKAEEREVLRDWYLPVFTTEMENRTMNSTRSRVRTSA